jgi:beta-glucosidase
MEKSEIEEMALKEKISLLSGSSLPFRTQVIDHLKIGRIYMTDGPHGLRKELEKKSGFLDSYLATCFPCACLSACSFDRDLMYCLGVGLGKEALDFGVDLLLGPGMNIKRNPLCGRNFEYFSEDPLLSGEIS